MSQHTDEPAKKKSSDNTEEDTDLAQLDTTSIDFEVNCQAFRNTELATDKRLAALDSILTYLANQRSMVFDMP